MLISFLLCLSTLHTQYIALAALTEESLLALFHMAIQLADQRLCVATLHSPMIRRSGPFCTKHIRSLTRDEFPLCLTLWDLPTIDIASGN